MCDKISCLRSYFYNFLALLQAIYSKVDLDGRLAGSIGPFSKKADDQIFDTLLKSTVAY